MSEQLARGLYANFSQEENPFGIPNGMEENLRQLDDHLALYTLQAPVPPGTALPTSPVAGDGQIYTDGSYAVFNNGSWRTYAARLGIRATLLNGSEAWTNNGAGWSQFSVLDSSAAIAAAQDAINPLVDAAQQARAGAEAALAQAQALAPATPGASLAVLAGDETNALVFDVSETDPTHEAKKVVDGVSTFDTLANLGLLTYGRKIVVKADGTWQWNRHNVLYKTGGLDDPTVWLQASCTATAGFPDSKGGTKSFKLTATATAAAASIRLGRAVDRENWFSVEGVLHKASADWQWVELYDGVTHRVVYFDLVNGVLGNVAAGLVANLYTTDADGNNLPAGYYAFKITTRWATATSVTVYCGPCDANGATNVTAGKEGFIEFLQLHYGWHRQAYVENPSKTASFHEAPYDYSTGKRRAALESSTTIVSNSSADKTSADWVKSPTLTVLYDPTGAGPMGPTGAPCSRLTFGSAGDTCLQAVAGGTARVANFAAKRVAGSGPIEITIDGINYTDISASLSTDKWTRFALAGGADSNFGYRGGTPGDQIDVDFDVLFNHPQAIVGETMFRQPRPVWSSSSQKATIGDQFQLASALWPNGWANGFSLYLDYDRPPGYTGFSDNIPFRAAKSDNSQYFRYTQTVTGADGSMDTKTSVGTRGTYLYKPNPGERMEITATLKPGTDNKAQCVMSINGEPIATHGSADSTLGAPVILGAPVMDIIELANLSGSPAGHTMYLRRLVVTPYAIDPRKVRTWRWSGTQKKKWLAMHEAFLPAELPNTKAQREASCQIISRDGDTVRFAVFCFQRHIEADYHNEMPGRLMQRNYKYTYSTNELVPETGPSVMYQDDRWAQKRGHTHSPTVFKDPYKLEWTCVLTHQDSADGTLTGDDRSIWVMRNKRADCHPSGWSAPVKLYDANAVFGAGYAIVLSNCEPLIFPPDHAVAPDRVCIPIYDSSNGHVRVMYSDTFGGADGTDWTLGPVNIYSGSATNINESTCSFWPDNNGKMGTAVYTWRTWNGAPQNQRVWGTSPDGINITFQGLIPSYQGAECSAGSCQLDPDGSKTGTPYGKIVLARPEYRGSTSKARNGARFSFFKDAAMTPVEEFFLFDSNNGNYRDRPFGYSSIKDTGMKDDKPGGTGGPICIYTVEGGSNGGQNDSSIYTFVLPLPAL